MKVTETWFHTHPFLKHYQELRDLARQLDRWETLQQEELAFLEQAQNTPLLIQIALEVARAAEETRPREARELYRQHAERLIAQRGRQNYQEACTYLAKMRVLYEKLGESEAWTSYIMALREQNRNLRALKEELAAAGL